MTREDAEVALDVLQDGSSSPEAVEWALSVVEDFAGRVTLVSEFGSASMSGYRRRRYSATSAGEGHDHEMSWSGVGSGRLSMPFSTTRCFSTAAALSDFNRPQF